MSESGELLRSAREDLARGWSVRAGTRLRQAAAAGEPDALAALLRALLLHQIPGGASEARARLEAGTALAPELLWLRATLRYVALGGPADPRGAIADLSAAASGGLAEAAMELALLCHEAGDIAGSRSWLSQVAASHALARDLLLLLPPAADAIPGSSPIPGDWPEQRKPATREQLSADPAIVRFREAFHPLECAWLRGISRPRLAPSLVVDPQTGRPRPDATRTSETMCFDPASPGVYARRMAARMARLAGRDPACGEPLSILRYRPGQEYKPHYDWMGAAGLAGDGFRGAGERAMTALGYLNVPDQGGATLFTRLDIRVEPGLGDVLVFSNLDSTGRPEMRSQHAGEPVAAGEKWLASLWIRERAVPLG
ncbi:MAG TPA: 2OG-Fe(II) oxygenase [Gammaproteobacteria bacterium]|nr:2OG-Fe(II) oxygenase [Gammaproteobacteria bacterium]